MTYQRDSRRAAFATDAAIALLAPATALILAEMIHSLLGINRLGLLFLAAVTFPASLRGSRAAIIAALAGVVCYKLFLDLSTGQATTPVEDIMNLMIFLLVALITGTLAGRVHDEAARAARQAARMEILFSTSRSLSDKGERGMWQTIADALANGTGCMAMTLDESGVLRGHSGTVDDAARSEAVQFGAEVLADKLPTIRRSRHWKARTVSARNSPAGVLLWSENQHEEEVDGFADLLSELASASLAHAHAQREQVRIQAAEEAGKLRQALLSSISHDFRSPLAAIIGSCTSLLEYGESFDTDVRRDLLLNIQHEGERLNQFVANLLNMMRLQSGGIQPLMHRVDASDVITAAIERIEAYTGRTPNIRTSGSCVVEADTVLLEQAIYNILDNAMKYGNPEHGIDVACKGHNDTCQIAIRDRGPGLSEEDLPSIFTSFHFVRKTGQAKGTGLGLSISRGFIEALGGSVEARNRTDGFSGLEVLIELPEVAGCTA